MDFLDYIRCEVDLKNYERQPFESGWPKYLPEIVGQPFNLGIQLQENIHM